MSESDIPLSEEAILSDDLNARLEQALQFAQAQDDPDEVRSETYTENASGNFEVINETDIAIDQLMESKQMAVLQRELTKWAGMGRETARSSYGPSHGNQSNMFDRTAYTPPNNTYSEFRAAKLALDTDDIVSGVAETTEGFAFQGVKWESADADITDVFNQMAGELDLDGLLRAQWRELFVYSQFVTAEQWEYREYTVRGKGPTPREKQVDAFGNETFVPVLDNQGRAVKGKKRKKTYRIFAPVRVRLLDSARIVPVLAGPLNDEVLALQATDHEINNFNSVLNGEKVDITVSQMFTGLAELSYDESLRVQRLGVDPDKLLELNPLYVRRHTLTRSDYERFAHVRLKSCFQLLDMKRQLLASDRAALVGSANYILLIKKGDKDKPATRQEMMNLQTNYKVMARLPVIISDHRLSVEIVAPKIDLTLQQDKYDVIDTRLMSRLLGTLSLGGRGQRNETNVTISYAVARGMENRRHMMKRFIERMMSHDVVNHPNNVGLFDEEPNLVFTPRNVNLGFDAQMMQAMLSLRTQREMSRETMLESVGLNESTEAMRMELEAEMYDDVFKTRVPYASPVNNQMGQPDQPAGQSGSGSGSGDAGSRQANGANGGRPVGGGTSKNDPSTAEPKSASGNTTPQKKI